MVWMDSESIHQISKKKKNSVPKKEDDNDDNDELYCLLDI